MKAMRKSVVHLAVAASMLAVVGAASSVAAQEVSRTGTGQALIFPYYTVNDGWITTFNFINTTPNTLALKFRLHERKNSRDVLDFNIVLSPYDMWSGWLQADGDKGPQLFTEDKSCTSPSRDSVNGALASRVAYTGQFDDTGGSEYPRMRDGYLEVLVMGESTDIVTPPTDFDPATSVQQYVPYFAEHVNGEPRDCSIVNNAFIRTTAQYVPGTNPLDYNTLIAGFPNPLSGSGDPLARIDFVAPTTNPLKGNVTWLHTATGAGAGSEAIAVSDWSDDNYVTAQQFPWFLEPTFATPGGGLWTVTGVVDFENAVSAISTFNEWADNPATGAVTDWVVTFPTKAFHVDQFNEQIQAASSIYRNGMAPVVACASNAPEDRDTCVDIVNQPPVNVAPFEWLFGVQGDGDSKITVRYDLYDREEGTTTVETDGTEISPAPPPEITVDTLRWEANVIAFGGESVLSTSSPTVLDASELLDGAPNGWARVTFTAAGQSGLPVAAFAVKVRDIGEVGTNYGQAMNNGYEPVTTTP